MKIAVLGGGAWGSVLASLLADARHDVALWEMDQAAAAALQADRRGPRSLPGHLLPASIAVTDDVTTAVRGRALLVLAVPSETIGAALAAARSALGDGVIIACASKGLEPSTLQTMDRVIEEAIPGSPVVLLSGPTFAQEIARGLPAAAVAASRDARAAETVQGCFASERFRIYTSDDVVGVAVGGALKNVIAIAVGACDGFGFGNNARAALITRGLAEMGRLASRLGADPMTLAGLAGLGDLVLTCTGELSRNRQVGLALARGEALPAILAQLGHIAEGIGTARTARSLADRLNVDMPITRLTAAVLHDGKSARDGVTELLSRAPKAE
ncbi:MAG: glycerol-3-phosphate dehydrogenase [Myxococcales bacterium]|nr:glycerol-3-phosphate dehydrogenase [Myxococcales bacterium]